MLVSMHNLKLEQKKIKRITRIAIPEYEFNFELHKKTLLWE